MSDFEDPRTEDEKRFDFEETIRTFFTRDQIEWRLIKLANQDEDTIRKYILTRLQELRPNDS